MQLSGKPRFNGWETPYPSYQRPLDLAFRRDEDVESYVKKRDGTVQRVGERHYRARLRFRWDALSYDLAHAILSAVSEHPVTVVPRQKESGDPSYLSEHSFDCRPIADLSTTTPLYRRGGQGNRLARIELELEALSTRTEIPDSITGGVSQVTP